MDNSYTDLLGVRPGTSVASRRERGGGVVGTLKAFYGDLAALKPPAITSASLSPYLMATLSPITLGPNGAGVVPRRPGQRWLKKVSI
ncbi:hypothetical protein D3C77_445320 [compost metagenome]